jgi:hypothetical protein
MVGLYLGIVWRGDVISHALHQLLFLGVDEFRDRSWRFAILVPIWQNCATGHWKHGHPFKAVGFLVHYGMIVFGIGFLIFQVLQADVVNTYQYIYGHKKEGIIQILGWGEESLLWYELEYPYMRCLVFSWLFYALLHVTGFSLMRIALQKQSSASSNKSTV